MSTLELHYFPLRGLAEQSRLALAVAGAEYTEVPVDYEKMKMDYKNFRYGQCPALKDGDFVLTQSLAILYYIGRKFDLAGSTDLEKALIDQAIQGVQAIRSKYLDLIYQDALVEDKKAAYWEKYGNPATAFTGERNNGVHWAYTATLLKENCADGKGFLIGKSPTIADCNLFDVLDLHVRVFEDEMKSAYPELMAFHANFAALPGVAHHIEHKRPSKVNGNTLG